MSGLFTQNIINNMMTIITLFSNGVNGSLKNVVDEGKEIHDSSIVLIRDHMGLYFNAKPQPGFNIGQQSRIYMPLYDPGNGITYWTTPDGQYGFNKDKYTNDVLSASHGKIYVYTGNVDQFIKDGTMEFLNAVDYKVIPTINMYPYNGWDGKYGNTVLYNFYFDPSAFASCIDKLPPVIASIYRYLLKQKNVVDLTKINPAITKYNLDEKLDDDLKPIKKNESVPASLGSKPEEAIILGKWDPSILDKKYIEVLKSKKFTSWKWIDSGCWLDNLLFAMFAPYPYLTTFENLMLNINLDNTLKSNDFYQKNKEIQYPAKYPTGICSNNIEENETLVKVVQSALRSDIQKLRSNQFDVCINLRKTIGKCKKIIHENKDLTTSEFRDPIDELYYPLINIFGLNNLVTIKKTACYYENNKANITIEDSYDREPLISIDITDPSKPISSEHAHLFYLMDQFKIKIVTVPPSEKLINLIQKTVYYTIQSAPILPIQIRRTYKKNDPLTGAVVEKKIIFTPIDIPEIYMTDGLKFKLRSIVIRMPNVAHFNSLINVTLPNNQTQWIYYHNKPGFDINVNDSGKNEVNIQFYDSYEAVLGVHGKNIREGCYLIFYEQQGVAEVVSDKFEYDKKCTLIPASLIVQNVNPNEKDNKNKLYYANDYDDPKIPTDLRVLGDNYIMSFSYLGGKGPQIIDNNQLVEHLLIKSLLATAVPKTQATPKLTEGEIKSKLKLNKNSKDFMDKLSINYTFKPELWTKELKESATEQGKKLFAKPVIYNNVNEFVREQYITSILIPKTPSVTISGLKIHELIQSMTNEQIFEMIKTKNEFEINEKLWTPELKKSAILLGRLLKLLNNPSLSKTLTIFKSKNSQLIGLYKNGESEMYWMDIINNPSFVKNYENQNQLELNKAKTDNQLPTKAKIKIGIKQPVPAPIPASAPAPVSAKIKIGIKQPLLAPVPAKIKIGVKQPNQSNQSKDIINSKIIPEKTLVLDNVVIVALTNGVKIWTKTISTQEFQEDLKKEDIIKKNLDQYTFDPPKLKDLYMSDEKLAQAILTITPVSYKIISSSVLPNNDGKYAVELSNGIKQWTVNWTKEELNKSKQTEAIILKDPSKYLFMPDELGKLYLPSKPTADELSGVATVAKNMPLKTKDLSPKTNVTSELHCADKKICESLFSEYQKNRTPVYVLPEGSKKTMGANLLYDTKAKKYAVDPTNWWFSEKYDGVRAVWTGKELLTRNGKHINAPNWFLALLPKDMALDGELYLGRKTFNQVQGVATSKIPDENVWKKLTFLIYDIPDSKDTFENRMRLLNYKLKGSKIIKSVEHIKIKNMDHFIALHTALVKDNAEGSMIRQPGSLYKYGHTNSLLKFKAQLDDKGKLIHTLDDDAVILDYEISTATTKAGCLKSFVVKWADKSKFPKDPKFKVGGGLTKAQTCGDYKKEFPVGTIIVVSYTELNDKTQAPRFPRFKEIRAEQN